MKVDFGEMTAHAAINKAYDEIDRIVDDIKKKPQFDIDAFTASREHIRGLATALKQRQLGENGLVLYQAHQLGRRHQKILASISSARSALEQTENPNKISELRNLAALFKNYVDRYISDNPTR